MQNKKLVGTVTKDDIDWQAFRAGGPGGQKQNKTSSACRATHKPSGAVGVARESRSWHENRKLAFRRMAEHPKMTLWLRIAAGQSIVIDTQVNEAMQPENIKIETKEAGRWKEHRGSCRIYYQENVCTCGEDSG